MKYPELDSAGTRVAGKRAFVYVRLIGVALFAYVLYRCDPRMIWKSVSSADVTALAAGAAAMCATFLTRALRWNILMRFQSFDVSLKASLKAFVMSLFFSLITPGRVGELSKPLLLGYRDRESIARLAVSTVLDRIWDVAVIVLLGLPLLWTYQDALDINLRSLRGAGLAAAGLVTAAVLVIRLTRRSSFWGSLLKRCGVSPELAQSLAGESRRLFFESLVPMGLLTIAGWALYVVMAACFARALHLEFGVMEVVFLVACGTLASLLPITVGGVGTRDGIYVVLFRRFGSTWEAAVSYSALFLTVNIVLAFSGWVIHTWFPNPKRDSAPDTPAS